MEIPLSALMTEEMLPEPKITIRPHRIQTPEWHAALKKTESQKFYL